MLHILKTDVLAESDDDSTLTRDVKKYILEYMEDKYKPDNIMLLLNIASYLDPQYCTSYIDDREEVVDKILDEVIDMLYLEEQQNSHTLTTVADEAQPEPPSKKRKLGSWLTKASNSVSNKEPVTPIQKVQREIEQYEHSVSADPDSNPLDWWRVHAGNYVVLSNLARKYLCITASSAPSERVFSNSKPEKVYIFLLFVYSTLALLFNVYVNTVIMCINIILFFVYSLLSD